MNTSLKNFTKTYGNSLAAVLLSINAVLVLYSNIVSRMLRGYLLPFRTTFIALLFVAGTALVVYPLITKRNKQFLAFGFTLLAAHFLLNHFNTRFETMMTMGAYYSSFRSLLTVVVKVAAHALAAALAIANTYGLLANLKDELNKFWYVPAALFIIIDLFNALVNLSINFRYYTVSFLQIWNYQLRPLCINIFLVAIPYCLVIVWMLGEVCAPNLKELFASAGTGRTQSASSGSTTASAETNGSEMHVGLIKHLLLTMFTCGIWACIWVYRTTDHLNRVEDEPPRNPLTCLLLFFVPFYYIYWFYKSAQRLDKLAAKYGVPSDTTSICLILAILLGFIPSFVIQDKLNAISVAMNGGTPSAAPASAPAAPAAPASTGTSYAEQLKSYKELLDMGVITREEFDAKKRELLNL